MGKKLLVADDSLTIQKVIKLALSHDGYEIQTVADGNELMAQLSLFRPDVVLMDLGLPGKSTFDVKKEVNSTSDLKDIPVVLMASAFEKVDEAKVALLKFDGRLTKPFDPSHLRDVLQKAISTRGIPEGFNPSELPPPPKPKSHQKIPPPTTIMPSPADQITLNDPIWGSDTLSNPKLSEGLPPPPDSTGFISRPQSVEDRHPDDSGSAFQPSSHSYDGDDSGFRLINQSPFDSGQQNYESPQSDYDQGHSNYGQSHSGQSSYEPNFDPLPMDEKTDEVRLPPLMNPDPAPESRDDSDIRQLTESTVKMSGLDDLGSWNINENASRGSSTSIPSIFDQDGSQPPSPPQRREPPRPPVDETRMMLSNSRALPPSPPKPSMERGHDQDRPTSFLSRPTSMPNRTEELMADLPTSKDIEDMVEKQVRAQLENLLNEQLQKQVTTQLEKYVKQSIPDLAERIVKQEIRKLLEGLS